MFEERFMEFGASPGDFKIRRTSFTTSRRFRDLGFEGPAPSSVSDGVCSPNGRSSPLSPIFNPFMYDQNHYRHHFKLNINDGTSTIGNDLGLCQNLSRMNISDDDRSALAQTGRFRLRVDRGGLLGSNGFSTAPKSSRYTSHGGGGGAAEQSWPNTGYYFGDDDSVIPQQCRFDLNMKRSMQRPRIGFYMNNVSRSSSIQSLSVMEGSGNLGLDDDSLIVPAGSEFEVASDFKNDENSMNQGLLLSLASMVEIYGSVYLMSKDQNGCRFLQRMLEEGRSIEATVIFHEVIKHLNEFSMDPFGNYLVQKLLNVCSEEQRMQIVIRMTEKPGQLIRISLNTYGTRVVQKLIETLGTKQQIALMKSALQPGFLSLVGDLNGNHVIQRCLQSLSPHDNQFLFEAATKFCVEIATHRHGCCVLQRCISYAVGLQRDELIAEISRNALLLAQDPFGNYVVQYIIEQNVPAENVVCVLKGHYVELSTQKFSSHVVEKCLRHYPESRSQIVRELISASHFEQLLQDPFANYVIQSALTFTKGNVRACLVEEVKAHSNLRTSPYCKRIFSRSLSKK